MTARGAAGPPAYRPRPLMSVASGVGATPAEGAGTWYLVESGNVVGTKMTITYQSPTVMTVSSIRNVRKRPEM